MGEASETVATYLSRDLLSPLARVNKKITPSTSIVLITGAKVGLLPRVEKNRCFDVEFMGVLRRKAGEFGSFGRF